MTGFIFLISFFPPDFFEEIFPKRFFQWEFSEEIFPMRFFERDFQNKFLLNSSSFMIKIASIFLKFWQDGHIWTWNEAIMNSNRKAKNIQPPCQDINFKSQAAWHSQSKGTYLSISNWLSGNLGYLVWCKWRMIALACPHFRSSSDAQSTE